MSHGANTLLFGALRGANEARLPTFKNAKGERAHSQIDGSDWSLADWMTALVGEVGELANKLKKIRRRDVTLAEMSTDIAKELADIQIYLDILAMQLKVDLGQATIDKFNEVSIRVGSPVRLATYDWHYERGNQGVINDILKPLT